MNFAIHHPRTAEGSRRRFEALTPVTVISRFFREQEICCQGEPSDRWFWIIAGRARRSVIGPDGRRQIVDLLLPGDCFGFTNGVECPDTVEAVVRDTYVASCARRDAEAVAESNSELAREIRHAAFETLSRLQAQVVVMGRVTALEKVGAYLLEMSERLSSRSRERLELPMSRYDIAAYLGLSVETVSRSLTQLKEQRAIKFLGPRSVQIVDRAALEGCRAEDDHLSRKCASWAGLHRQIAAPSANSPQPP